MAIKITIDGTDFTGRLDLTAQCSWNMMKGSPGNCSIPLHFYPGDGSVPGLGQIIYIYEVFTNTDPATEVRVWAGFVQRRSINPLGNQGHNKVVVTGVSLEALFQAVDLKGYQIAFPNGSGQTVTGLFAVSGLVSYGIEPGQIDEGATLLGPYAVNRFSDAIQEFATRSNFIWYVDPFDLTLNFHAPDARAGDFVLTGGILWPSDGTSSINYSQDGTDTRSTQVIQNSATVQNNVLTPRVATFTGDDSSGGFVLPAIPSAVTRVLFTRNVAASQVGVFSDNPQDGDTFHIDPSDTVTYDPYTFVAALDNSKYGQILIGATAEDTKNNAINAINGDLATRGITYSTPTFANPLASAESVDSATLRAVAKKYGTAGNAIALSSASAVSPIAFLWTLPNLDGGISTDVGSLAGFTWSWNTGTDQLTVTPAVPTGVTILVYYTLPGDNALGGDSSTGSFPARVQRYTLGTYFTPTDETVALQGILARFGGIPAVFEFDTDLTGIAIGRVFTVTIDAPAGGGMPDILNGDWIVQEIQASLIPGKEKLVEPNGHFRYKITFVNGKDVATFVQAYEQLANVGVPQTDTSATPSTTPDTTTPAGQQWVQEQLGLSPSPSGTDLAVDDTDDTVVRSFTHTFGPDDVGRILTISTGGSWTPGAYTILSVATGAATLDSSPAATATTGGIWSLATPNVFQFTWEPMVSTWTGNQIALVHLITAGGVTNKLTPFRFAEVGYHIDPIDPTLGGDYVITGKLITFVENPSDGDIIIVEYFPKPNVAIVSFFPSGTDMIAEGAFGDFGQKFFSPSHLFTADDIGKVVHITGGVGWTLGAISIDGVGVDDQAGWIFCSFPDGGAPFGTTGGIWELRPS